MKNFKILSEPRKIYAQMLLDISRAKKYIFLETYIYGNDFIGKKFRDLLAKKAEQGVKVHLLLDSWGSYSVNKFFFDNLIKKGGKVKFFREIKYILPLFLANHERNHRKILVIDDETAYIGSANITSSCLNWREIVIRFQGPISSHFKDSFLNSWNYSRIKKVESMLHKGFQIINDFPKKRKGEKKYLQLIRGAQKSILIETPYFVPSIRLRRALSDAVSRGVDVKLILPHISDVKITDIIRNRYLGNLYKKGLKIFFFMPKILHSKLLIVDNKFFLLGSSNVDYRSFMHQFEINVIGKDPDLIKELERYYQKELKDCRSFNYKNWKNRSSFRVGIEILLHKIRKYL